MTSPLASPPPASPPPAVPPAGQLPVQPVPSLPRAETMVHLRQARDVIDRRFAEALDLDTLADEAGFSRYHFARSFRNAFGETPAAYLTRRRIERAKQLLAGANLTVTEVCYLVGFKSLGSFSGRFTKLVGRSPSAYRDAVVASGGHRRFPAVS